MKPLRLSINRIADFGVVVSLVGSDVTTSEPVTVHVDHRPFAAFWTAWHDAGLPPPIEYAADRLILHLDMQPEADGEVRLVEARSQDAATSDSAFRSVEELEQ